MPNDLVREFMTARIEGLVADARSLRTLEHNVVKGRLRELVFENLLSPVLPPSFILGSGAIVDHNGKQSGEIDIVICNRSALPPFIVGIRDGLFPVESCLYALEIKSEINLAEARETLMKFGKVHGLATLPGGLNIPPKLHHIPANRYRPVTALFGFRGSVTKKMLLQLPMLTVAILHRCCKSYASLERAIGVGTTMDGFITPQVRNTTKC